VVGRGVALQAVAGDLLARNGFPAEGHTAVRSGSLEAADVGDGGLAVRQRQAGSPRIVYEFTTSRLS
jgi:hypothetical protein